MIDNPGTIYLILGVAAIGLGVAWWHTRQRKYLIGLGVAGCLLVALWLLSHFIVTDNKRIIGVVEEMAAAVGQKDANKILDHVSDQFHSEKGTNKEQLRGYVQRYLKEEVTEAKVWGFEPVEVSRKDRKAVIDFMTKAKGNIVHGQEFFRCRTEFVLDPDGRWRVKTFHLYPPQSNPNNKQALDLPF